MTPKTAACHPLIQRLTKEMAGEYVQTSM